MLKAIQVTLLWCGVLTATPCAAQSFDRAGATPNPSSEIRAAGEPSLVPLPAPPQAGGDGTSYQQREGNARDLEGFTGGTVVIVASVGVVVLVLVLVILLIL